MILNLLLTAWNKIKESPILSSICYVFIGSIIGSILTLIWMEKDPELQAALESKAVVTITKTEIKEVKVKANDKQRTEVIERTITRPTETIKEVVRTQEVDKSVESTKKEMTATSVAKDIQEKIKITQNSPSKPRYKLGVGINIDTSFGIDYKNTEANLGVRILQLPVFIDVGIRPFKKEGYLGMSFEF